MQKDWKLFRTKLVQWQENYMEKLNSEYIEILQRNENASEKFWHPEERIKTDSTHAGVRLCMRKSGMISVAC